MTVSGWETFAQFGLAGIIFGGFLLVLHWVFKVNHKILNGMESERVSYQEILKGFSDNIRDNRESNKIFHAEVAASHAAAMREHKEMIASLGRINGYKS